MNEKLQRKYLRSKFSQTGWTLLIYYGIMNLTVTMVIVMDMIYRMMVDSAGYGDYFDGMDNAMLESVMSNAWGYFLAAVIGLLIMLLWKGRKFCFQEIWTRGRPMGTGDFFGLLCVFVCGQLVFQLAAVVLEMLLNLFGLSAMEAIESAAMDADSFSMYLYAGLLAPIVEELLFRGLILRTLMPYGKKFAILTSAVLFGIYHGNLVQSPFAFAVGLVLGYTAVEYSIGWAMVLHMFNNLILSDMITRLTSGLSETAASLISWGIILVLSAGGIVVAIVKRKKIAAYLRQNSMNRMYLKSFFSSPGIIAITVVMALNMLLTITLTESR